MSKLIITPENLQDLTDALAELVVTVTPTGNASDFLEAFAESINEKYQEQEAQEPNDLEASAAPGPTEVKPVVEKTKLAQAVLAVLEVASRFTPNRFDDHAVEAARAIWFGFNVGAETPFKQILDWFKNFRSTNKARRESRRERTFLNKAKNK